MPYVALQAMLDGGAPKGLRNYFRGGFVDDLDDQVIDVALDHGARMPSPMSQIHLHQMGGAVAESAGRHRVQRSPRRLHLQRHLDVDRPDRRRTSHRREPATGRGVAPAVDRRRVRELRRRRRCQRGPHARTAIRCTSGWRGSSASTTRRTCSIATRTSGRHADGVRQVPSRCPMSSLALLGSRVMSIPRAASRAFSQTSELTGLQQPLVPMTRAPDSGPPRPSEPEADRPFAPPFRNSSSLWGTARPCSPPDSSTRPPFTARSTTSTPSDSNSSKSVLLNERLRPPTSTPHPDSIRSE